MQTQGNLLKQCSFFNSFEEADMMEACDGLKYGLNTFRPLQLLFIVQKIKKIGG